ncbi:hypothetical protein Leryth_010956 [Lithospermum erythrorhizon]|nr:hypothetical protein Leryth_010956 [Lithospermum erythrorhizon]
MSLSANHISGQIPEQFNNLTHLKDLQLFNNSLSGSLPEKVCLGGQLQNFTANQMEEFTEAL